MKQGINTIVRIDHVYMDVHASYMPLRDANMDRFSPPWLSD
jgi:hypothetical protein